MPTYCTALQVRQLAQIAYGQLAFQAESDFDTFIEQTIIPAAQKKIDQYCNHNFLNNTATITLDGNGQRTLIIPPPYVPVLTVTSVTQDGVAINLSNIKVYPTFIKNNSGYFYENAANAQNISIALTHGYTTVPADVAEACAQLCANKLNDMLARKIMPDVMVKLTKGDGGTAPLLGMSLTAEIKEVLDRYKYLSGVVV